MKINPVKGTADYLPSQTLLRDYLQNIILETYREAGFERIMTPAIEDMENLEKSEGGDNLNLMFKILKRGDKLSAALAGNRFVPASMVPMLRVGEESGTVGEMLAKIASHLENDTKLKIKRLLSLFEPAVIVFLALIVLVVVVSIFVAMMEINSISQGGPAI